MKKNFKVKSLNLVVLFMFLGMAASCSKEEVFMEQQSGLTGIEKGDHEAVLSAKTINVGQLDDRDSKNSYREVMLDGNLYGRYRIDPTGNTDPNNSVRIERRFDDLRMKPGLRAIFSATYRINRVDDRRGTYIAQTHAFNTDGSIKGPSYLLRVYRNGSNNFDIYIEYNTEPNGRLSQDTRKLEKLVTVGKDEDFDVRIITGYSINTEDTRAFNTIFINGERKYSRNQPYITDRMYFRYGAYTANNNISTVFVRNTNYSLDNND